MTPTTSKSSSVSGRPLRGQAREIVYNVAQYFKELKEQHNLQNANILFMTSRATGVSVSTVTKILKEGKEAAARSILTFSTPTGKKAPRKKRIEVDSLTDCSIRQKIHSFYVVKKEIPTIGKLLSDLKEDGVIDCEREFLRQRIKKLGFSWKTCQSKRKLLIERSDISVWRLRYLHQITQFRREGWNIVYIDETYIQQAHMVGKCWQSEEEIGATSSIGAGQRLIIVHGGGEEGFVEGALLIFKSGQKTGDYHTSMNFDNFRKWLESQLLPALSRPSVIIMDNARYHCNERDKVPTQACIKNDIIRWLQNHNAQFDPSMTKAELIEIVRTTGVHNQKQYLVDDIIHNHGHIPLRLPPYHPDLNPIELVWGDIKGQVAQQSIGGNLKEKEELCRKLFHEYSAEKWKKCCEHVIKKEQEYMHHNVNIDNEMDRIIITDSTGGNVDTSDEEYDNDSDDSNREQLCEEGW